MAVMTLANVEDLTDRFVALHGAWYILQKEKKSDLSLCVTKVQGKPFFSLVMVATKTNGKDVFVPEFYWVQDTQHMHALINTYWCMLKERGLETKLVYK